MAALIGWLAAPGLTAAGAFPQDRRDEIARESRSCRARHFPEGRMPSKHDWRQPSGSRPPFQEIRETPGGVGCGYFYDTDALLWTNCSIADYYVVAPTLLDQTVSFLYLTSTCRAQLGTESLVAYEDNDEAQFWIYDWSYAADERWQVMIDLPASHPEFLAQRPDEFAVTRQMVHVRNGTFCLGNSNGVYNWQNQTLLFDFVRGDWDLIYSRDYTTTNLTDNIPVASGEYQGFWGPIVETFQIYTDINPVGFDLIRLFQDGNASPFWLTPANSYSVQDGNWTLLTEAQNTSFTVSIGDNSQPGGPYNMGTLCVTANTNTASFTISPPAGTPSPYWIINPNSNSWDNTVVGLPPGDYAIAFSPVAGMGTPVQQNFSIAANTITGVQAVYGTNVPAPVLQSLSLLGQTLTCDWSAQPSVSYQVQQTGDLAQTNWSNVGDPVTATSGTVTTSLAIPAGSQAFYRLLVLP